MCECCNDESGGKDVGVASIPGVPCSIMWCDSCLRENAVPQWVFDHDFIFVANGNLDNLAEWAKDRVCWDSGKYISFSEYVKRITPEQVKEELDKYYANDPNIEQ